MQNQQLKKIIYVPVQHVTRDLASRLLLAKAAMNSGWNVMLVKSRWLIENIEKVPLGVVFFGTSPTVIDSVKKIKAAGHYYVAECDEAGMWNKKRYLTFKAALPNLYLADLYLAWGERHASLIAERYDATPIVITGSPRIDLSLSDSRLYEGLTRKINEKHGRYILISSNGLTPLSRYSSNDIGNIARHLANLFPGMSYAEYQNSFREFFENGEKFWNAIKKIIKSNRNVNFLYRPRFGDDIQKTREELSNFSNVEIVESGSINPFLMAAEGVIHQNCTSGLEAAVMGRPTIDYSPIKLSYPFAVAVDALPAAASAEDVDRFVKRIWHGAETEKYIAPRKSLAKYIKNISSDVSASQKIVDILDARFKEERLINVDLKFFRDIDQTANAYSFNKINSGWVRFKRLAKKIIIGQHNNAQYHESLSAHSIQLYAYDMGIAANLSVNEVCPGKSYFLAGRS